MQRQMFKEKMCSRTVAVQLGKMLLHLMSVPKLSTQIENVVLVQENK